MSTWIIWIHWLKTDIEKYNFWPNLKKEYWENIHIPQLPNNEETTYEEWKKEFDKINFNEYEIIVAHSMWCRMLFEYIVENKIKINKILLLAPAFSSMTNKINKKTWLKDKRKELEYTYKTLPNYFLTKENINIFSDLVSDLLLYHSREDYRISHLWIRLFLENFDKGKIKTIHNKNFWHFLWKDDYKYFENEI